jgi:dTDP-4-amino-4,6-dideoxygalactose transaminase
MIPLAIPNLSGNERKYLNECVDSTFVSSVGPFVDKFEMLVSLASGCKNSVATSSGTTGLHASLVSVGVLPGELVLIPGLSFIATANAVSHAHAIPWMIDIDNKSWTMDPDKLLTALKMETTYDSRIGLVHKKSQRRVAAILPVYTLGLPADMDRIRAIAQEFNLPIVADAAAALGATYKGRPVGDLGADLTMFSFNGNKTVTAGGGGAVSGSNDWLISRLRHLTTTARVGSDYDHDMVGFNYRMTNIQAAVGCAQMELLEKFVQKKREISKFYKIAFEGLKGISPFPEPEFAISACWFSGFTLDNNNSVELRKKLRELGVDARPFWKPLHYQKPYLEVPRGDLSYSEKIWDRIVTLPCSTSITQVELNKVAEAVIISIKSL